MSISSTATRNAPQFCEGLRDIADQIDGLILDLWGCMHDGIDCYPAALDCLKEARRLGKRVGIISNAPRRAALVGKRIAEMGITPDLYDGLYSSGEETWRALRDRNFLCYFIGSVTSDFGTWLQNTAQILLAYRLSHSALVAGLVTCGQFSSPLLLGPLHRQCARTNPPCAIQSSPLSKKCASQP